MKQLNWLHFTDLHFHINNREWHWPTSKKYLFDDIEKLSKTGFGLCDLIIFSGDLTQSGEKEQFNKVTEILEDIYSFLKSRGSNPVFLSVPGNHDLNRPLPTIPVVKALSNWHVDKDIQFQFLNDANSEYRAIINEAFSNYSTWWDSLTSLKPLSIKKGILPGDFSAVIEKYGIRLGVVGLNSSFLQLTNDDFEGRLDILEEQLFSVCDNDPDTWCDSCDIPILMTHHNYKWLDESSQKHFLSNIYPPGRFFSHIHGHLHNSSTINISIDGSRERRFRQGPSLFGLKYWGKEKKERIFGYIAGQFDYNNTECIERLWPRILLKKGAGHYRLDPDLSYDLDISNSISTTFNFKNDKVLFVPIETVSSSDKELYQHDTNLIKNSSEEEYFGIDISLFDENLNEEIAKKKLKGIPRLNVKIEPQHINIRLSDQARLELLLQRDHCVYLIYDWGLAKEGFLSSIYDRFIRYGVEDFYHIMCDESNSMEEFELQVVNQFGMTIQQFCALNSITGRSILIIDEVPSSLFQSNNECKGNFQHFITTILDFCPNLYVIITLRQLPSGNLPFESIKLLPLDATEVATYVANHPKSSADLTNITAIDEILMRSEGLPMHIDRLIETLQVASLNDLFDIELDTSSDCISSSEPVPKSLIQDVATLAKSSDSYTRRSFQMLKVLSMLPEGASLQTIRRFNSAEPFYYTNALELIKLSLLKVDTYTFDESVIKINHSQISQGCDTKCLFVPRQVRDYINSIITKEERTEIIKTLADLLFGYKWREGDIKISQVSNLINRGIKLGPGNEHVIVLLLLRDAIQRNDNHNINLALRLGINYCLKLKNKDRYRDACIASGELISLIKDLEFTQQYVELSIIHGQSLRMIDQQEEALSYFQTSLELDNNFLTKKKLADIYLEIAFIYDKQNNNEKSKEFALKAQKYVNKTSSIYIQSEAIIAGFEEDRLNRKIILQNLEKKARNKGYLIVANNIAHDLLAIMENPKEKLTIIDSVLSSNDDPYNRIRAVIKKAKYLTNDNKINELNKRDQQLLSFAYSFLYSQRMTSLFSKCHAAIWEVLKVEGNFIRLLQAFRLSSFIWRMRGEVEIEKRYLTEITEYDLTEIRNIRDEQVLLDINYFDRRLQQIS